jgi:putative PIN family toxin of toxin-antitoxin system
MKVVVDTNVIVSALLTPAGVCGQILDLLVEGVLLPCVDERMLAEYEDVLLDPRFPFMSLQVNTVLEMFRTVGEPVAATPLDACLPDEDDRPFLEVAAAGGAALVTGNVRHYPKQACRNVTVLRPREVLDLLRHAP